MPTANSSRRTWALLGLVVASFAVRIHGLLQLPGFVDEGNHLRWAVEIWQGRLLFPFSTAKGLEIYYLAGFLPFDNPLWPGRAASVLAGSVTLSGLWALARSWGRPTLGLWAVAIYGLMPWSFFHERLAVADPLAAAGGVVLAWTATQWVRRSPRNQWNRTWALALCLFALPLIKLSALPLLALPPIVALLHAERPDTLRGWRLVLRPLWLPYAMAAVGLAAVLGLAALRYDVIGETRGRTGTDLSSWVARSLGNLQDLSDWSAAYLGVLGPLLLLGLAAAGLRRMPLSVLALAGLLLSSGILVISGSAVFPRYYLGGLAFGALLVAHLFQLLGSLVQARWLRWSVDAILVAGLAAPYARFATQAYRDPAQLGLPEVDRAQHVTSWSAGYGIRDATAYLVEQVEGHSMPAVVYSADLATWRMVQLYWPVAANGQPYELWDAAAPPVIDTVAAGVPTYLVVDTTRDTADFSGLTINPLEQARFGRPPGGAPIIVYRLVPEPFELPEQ